MKIAIYHNLNKGGALVQLEQFIKSSINKNEIDIYSLNRNLESTTGVRHFYYKISETKNIFEHLYQVIFEINRVNKKIAETIKSRGYSIVLVFPCNITQSPDILRFLRGINTSYIFAEPKREFYEKTSFDHTKPNKVIARIMRISIMIKDQINCRSAYKIVTNSLHSKHQMLDIYGKKSTVIYPGLSAIKPKQYKVKIKKNVLMVGQLSYLKGYDLAFEVISKCKNKNITIIGRKTGDYPHIKSIADKLGITIKLITTDNDSVKNKEYKKHSIFLAFQRNEPFGITTMEACYNNNIIFGLNEGGTSEIIHHGLNGYLFNINELNKASLLISRLQAKKIHSITKVNTMSWKKMSNKMLSICSNE